MQGIAVPVDPADLVEKTGDTANHLLLVKVGPDMTASYWTGFAWDKAGQCTSEAAWKNYVQQFAVGQRSPIKVSVVAP